MPRKSKTKSLPAASPLNALREKFGSQASALDDEVVYALPSGLIEEIGKEQGILTPMEMQFEFELAEASGAGLFLGEPFGYLSLARGPNSCHDDDFVAALSSIKAMVREARQDEGFELNAIDAALQPDSRTEQRVMDRREGYAGWLVTSAKFRSQRDAIRCQFHSTIKELGRFPPLFPSVFGLGVAPDLSCHETRRFNVLFDFYQKWGLSRMVTWDLPVPMRPDWSSSGGYFLPQLSEDAGLKLFIPWYLMRNKDLKLEDVADLKRPLLSPPEIREWLEGDSQKDWGPDRFATMLRIYVYLELALKRRYKVTGKLGKLDAAFARFLSPDMDGEASGSATVKKIRWKMATRLRPAK